MLFLVLADKNEDVIWENILPLIKAYPKFFIWNPGIMSAIIGTPRTTTPNHTYTDESIIGHYGVTNVLGRLIMMANLDFCGKNYDSKTLHFLTVCY